jgi:hypothetical protein
MHEKISTPNNLIATIDTSQQPVQLARASYSDNTLKILSKDIFICMFRNEIFLFIK